MAVFVSFIFARTRLPSGLGFLHFGAVRRKQQVKQHAVAGTLSALPLTAWRPPAGAAWTACGGGKDLLYMKRDMREWFGYLIPLIIMVFFIAQYLLQVNTAQSS